MCTYTPKHVVLTEVHWPACFCQPHTHLFTSPDFPHRVPGSWVQKEKKVTIVSGGNQTVGSTHWGSQECSSAEILCPKCQPWRSLQQSIVIQGGLPFVKLRALQANSVDMWSLSRHCDLDYAAR